jgi:hypothetical protein
MQRRPFGDILADLAIARAEFDRADAELEARLGLDAIAARRREIALERERKAANRVTGPQANRWFIN